MMDTQKAVKRPPLEILYHLKTMINRYLQRNR
ncbi:MAG: hypothetical protein ACJAU1_001274 [Psychromonas sp.]|jgi:hypothetical protein